MRNTAPPIARCVARPVARRVRVAAWVAMVLAAAGCSAHPAPRPLDARLAAGETRAGVVTGASELIGGLGNQGRVGDYKIYNSKVAVVISKPGDSRGYHPYGGSICEADRIRAPGEKGNSRFGELIPALDLAVMKPTRVEIVSAGAKGTEARLRFHGEEGVMPLFDSLFQSLFATKIYDMDWDIDYALAPDADALEIDFRVFNRGTSEIEFGLPMVSFFFMTFGAQPFMPGYGFALPGPNNVAEYMASVGDDVSYLYGKPGSTIGVIVNESGAVVAGNGDPFKLLPHQTATFKQYLVIGDGDLSKTQASWRKLAGEPDLVPIPGTVVDAAGAPVAGARVHVTRAGADPGSSYVTLARTGSDGRFKAMVESGDYLAQAAGDFGLFTAPVPFSAAAPGAAPQPGVPLAFTVPLPGKIHYHVTDEAGRNLPVKLTVQRASGSPDQLPANFGEPRQDYGLTATIFGIGGDGEAALPAGRYHLYASRGGEYEIADATLEVSAGQRAELSAALTRSVDTTGWQSTDTHVHAQLSPDSPDLYPLKVMSMVTEGLELPVSTDHDSLGDFNPAIHALGLDPWIQGIVGSEVTTFTYGHFNAFPLIADPTRPRNGRIDWFGKPPAETFKAIRAAPGQPFLQVNHPRSATLGGYFSTMGLDRDTFTFTRPSEMSFDFDGIEVANGCDVGFIESETMLDWFAFLNHGYRVYATGSTDNHSAASGDMGFPRTYVRMPTDDPSAARGEDFRAAFVAGRLTVSCGPFLEVTSGGAEVGDTVRTHSSTISLRVRVAAPSWMDVSQLEVVVNGQTVRTIALTAAMAIGTDRFRGVVTAPLPPRHDAWVIVRVRGAPHGVWARGGPSYAFTNPIFVDGDSDGAWTMP